MDRAPKGCGLPLGNQRTDEQQQTLGADFNNASRSSTVRGSVPPAEVLDHDDEPPAKKAKVSGACFSGSGVVGVRVGPRLHPTGSRMSVLSRAAFRSSCPRTAIDIDQAALATTSQRFKNHVSAPAPGVFRRHADGGERSRRNASETACSASALPASACVWCPLRAPQSRETMTRNTTRTTTLCVTTAIPVGSSA